MLKALYLHPNGYADLSFSFYGDGEVLPKLQVT